MGMSPSGRVAPPSSVVASVGPATARAARGRGRRARLRARLGGGLASATSPLGSSGSASTASVSGASGARLRSEAKRGYVARAASTLARTYADMRTPSVILPPSARSCPPSRAWSLSAGALAPSRENPAAASSASARAAFIRGGYAAAAVARACPAASLPCATCAWPSSPCVQTAASSAPARAFALSEHANVVYLRVGAPRAHCANVTVAPPVIASAARMRGSCQSGAWSCNLGHHAAPSGSPQSAGFSIIQGTPAACAASASSAEKAASVLCLAMYRLHRAGTGWMPSGSALLRSCGVWATEKDAQGGAAKTASQSPSRTLRSTSAATSARVRSWSRPPILTSMAVTFAPRQRSSDSSVDRAAPSPAKAMSTWAARGAPPSVASPQVAWVPPPSPPSPPSSLAPPLPSCQPRSPSPPLPSKPPLSPLPGSPPALSGPARPSASPADARLRTLSQP
eukprot:849220-Pleurochrysis_carterae.AAC.1